MRFVGNDSCNVICGDETVIATIHFTIKYILLLTIMYTIFMLLMKSKTSVCHFRYIENIQAFKAKSKRQNNQYFGDLQVENFIVGKKNN